MTFFLSLYILFPRTGANSLPLVEQFNTVEHAIIALFDLALIGEKVDIKILSDAFDALSPTQSLCAVLWICLYYMFLIISLILMINLLIAMMSNTITEVSLA